MRLLLTGAGGFIGKRLLELLREEHEVFAPRSFELDLRDAASTRAYIESHDMELIIHSASCGVQRADNTTLDAVSAPNLAMFRNLANCVTEARRMINLGSGAEYDKSKPIVVVREEDFGLSVPKDPYGYSKYLISKEIEKRERIINLRIFGVYGEGEHASRVTSSIISDYIQRRPIALRQNVRFSFIYLDDLCRIIRHFVNHPPRERFLNIAHPVGMEITQLARIVNTFADWESPITVQKQGMNHEYTCDVSGLCAYGFRFTPYESGLLRLFHHLSGLH